jgi:hypothetical protein
VLLLVQELVLVLSQLELEQVLEQVLVLVQQLKLLLLQLIDHQ